MKPLSLNTPHLIVMVGIPGAGKTFFAEHFSETFKAPYVNFERLRSELFNEPTYNAKEKAIISRVSNYLLDELFKTGQTIVLEVPSSTKAERQAITRRAKDNGYEPLIVWVQTESSSAKARSTKAVKGKHMMSSEVFDSAIKTFSAPGASESPIVISGKHTYASQLKIVLSRLIPPKPVVQTSPPLPTGAERRRLTIR